MNPSSPHPLSRRWLIFGSSVIVVLLVALWASWDAGQPPPIAPPIRMATQVPSPSLLKIGFSFAKPPYSTSPQFADIDPATHREPLGFEVEIFATALQRAGYKFKPVFQPFARVIADLANGNLDGGETSGPPEPGIFYSQPIINCENYVITKKSSGRQFTTLQDLAGVKMVAWQGAATDLGPEFTAICRNNTLYIENTNQEAQYQMFAEGKVEAIVIDKYIFEWWRKQYEQKSGRSEDMVYHPLFPGVNPYHIGFRDQRIRDAFDHQLILMREKGEIEGIIAAYSSSPRVSKPVASKAVTVGFGLSRPPFVLEKEQRGIAVDLAFEAFRRLGLPIRPLFMTKQRMEEQLSIGGIDIGFDVRSFSPEIFYSDPVITYHSCFVGHASQPPLRNWADLAGQRVAAWQLAEHHLGADFTAIRPQMKDYREYPVQHDQVDAWINRQTDVLLIDRNIFLWFCQQAGANAPDLSQVQIQPLPGDPGRHEAAGFRSAALRDRFTLVLRDIKADGTYSRILNRYGAGN